LIAIHEPSLSSGPEHQVDLDMLDAELHDACLDFESVSLLDGRLRLSGDRDGSSAQSRHSPVS
jgi:hypothetical protein